MTVRRAKLAGRQPRLSRSWLARLLPCPNRQNRASSIRQSAPIRRAPVGPRGGFRGEGAFSQFRSCRNSFEVAPPCSDQPALLLAGATPNAICLTGVDGVAKAESPGAAARTDGFGSGDVSLPCPGPVPLIGKKISGSADPRHAAKSHQLLVAVVATITPPVEKVATYPGWAVCT